jgi:hypothetical protein
VVVEREGLLGRRLDWAQEVPAMEGPRAGRLQNARTVRRVMRPTRLEPHVLASVYELLLPPRVWILSSPAPAPSERQPKRRLTNGG